MESLHSVVFTAICFLKRKMPSDFSYTDVGGTIQQLGKLVFKEQIKNPRKRTPSIYVHVGL